MAIRPVVFVYQDLATPTVTPTSPDLNCLVVGPGYWIQDYFAPGTTDYADKTDIQITTPYGALEVSPDSVVVPPSGPAVITVAEPPNNAVGALLDGTSVKIYFDQARVRIAGKGVDVGGGIKGITTVLTPNQFDTAETIPGPTTFATTGPGKVLPGDRLVIIDAGTVIVKLTVATVVSDTRLLLTSDYTGGTFTPAANQHWYIERRINDVLIDSSFVSHTGNIVKIAGGVTLPVTGQGPKPVSYAIAYEAYRSLRQDLVDLDTVESQSDILTKIGRIDARNPLATGAFVALQNTTSVVQFIGVLSNDLQGHVTVRDHLSARPDIYAIIPLTTDVSIFAMWNADCVGLALPDNVRGRPQRFRVVIGNGTLPITDTIIQPSATGQSLQLTASAPTALTKVVLTGVADLVVGGVIPSDILRVTVTSNAGDIALGDYPIASVESATTIEVNTSTPFAGAGVLNITASIVEADGTTVRIASAPLIGVITSAGDDLYLILKDPSGTFVSSGVAAGDEIQIPVDPNSTITTSSVFVTLIVNNVISDQRLQIVNNGPDSSTVQNELPHGVKRIGGALVSLLSVNYQIVRTLSKSQQVTELVALAQSFNSKRTILVWPDKCDVAGVTGGTKQPGYYLACAVGGMTAGLPPQQGFTNLGIAGVSQIYESNTYFTDSQLTDISNGGWFVFAQQTTSSLPFSIHQLTTDPSTLESGEFSVVKDFDFVSLFFVDILEDFLGQYNVTVDTLTQLHGALITGSQILLLRTVAKIGAPITSFTITQLSVSPTSGDRVLIYCAIGLPKPLNVIELHLVA
jgi:hypothetical protein